MVNSLRLNLLRDRKEVEIDGVYNSIKYAEETRVLYKKTLETKLTQYQKWKTDNKMEGVKY